MSTRYYNTLEIIGDQAQIKAIKEFIRGTQDELGQEVYFDFNKVIEMPEELKKEYEELFVTESRTNLKEESIPNVHDELFTKQQECLGNYINWCYKNWQVKWIPFNQESEEGSMINYTTINGRGLIIIEKLSQMFPANIFVLTSFCESPDDEIYHFKNGEIMLFAKTD